MNNSLRSLASQDFAMCPNVRCEIPAYHTRPQQLLFIWILLWSLWEVSGDLCLEVCEASTIQEDKHKFTFEGKKVFCAEEACLVRPMKYKVYELSNPSPEVSFEVKLLKLTGIKLKRNELDLGMWLRMHWYDPRLKLCACGKAGQELGLEQEVPADTRKKAHMQENVEEHIWTPDFTVKERAHSVRREGNLLDFLVEADEESSGVNIGFTVNLRVAVKCKFKTMDYPFNKNNCPVTIVPYNHEHDQSVKFVIRNMTMRNILYKDLKVDVCPQLRENGEAAKNGFMVVLDRRGGGEFRTYEFTMRAFVVTSILAVALSPRYTDVSFIGEAVLTGFYIDFDLYNKSPPVAEEDGGKTLLEEVMH